MIDERWFRGVATRERRLKPGEVLFHQGDPTFAIFAVAEGRVHLVRHGADGREALLHVAPPGGTFSEAALFSPVYHCTAVAEEASRVIVVPKDALLRLFDAEPAAARAFMHRLASQVQALRSRLEVRNIRSAADRAAHALALRADGGVVTLDRPLKDLAAEIGLTHEAFYRALAALQKAGRIARDRRSITILRDG